MKLNGNLVLNSNASGEIRNAYIERLGTQPPFVSQERGRIYFNTGSNLYFFNDGSAWAPFATGGSAAALQIQVDNIRVSIGPILSAAGVFDPAYFSTTPVINTATTLTDALTALANATSAASTLAGMTDVNITSPQLYDVLVHDGSNWNSGQPGSGTGVQKWGASLDSLVTGGTGFVAMNGTGVSWRTVVPPTAGFTIAGADGSGNLVFELSDNLAAVENLSGDGFAVKTAAGVWAARSITSTLSTLTITNGDGVAGDIDIDLPALTIGNSGMFSKFSHDAYGRITASIPVSAGDITSLVNSVYARLSGSLMAGDFDMGSVHTVKNLKAPTAAGDAATKKYVDDATGGTSSAVAQDLADLRIYVDDQLDADTWEVPVISLEPLASYLPVAPVTGSRFAINESPVRFTTWDGAAWVDEIPVVGAAFYSGVQGRTFVFNGTQFVPTAGPGQAIGVGLLGGLADPISVDFDNNTIGLLGNSLFVKNGGIGTSQIADDAVSTVKIPDGAITHAKLEFDHINFLGNIGDEPVLLGGDVAFAGYNGLNVEVVPLGNGIAVNITNEMSLDDILDTDIGTLNPFQLGDSGSVLTYGGLTNKWAPQKIYHLYESFAADVTHVVTHDIGQKFCHVTVVDTSDEVIFPLSIKFDSSTQLTVTFTNPTECKVIVMGVDIRNDTL